MHEQIVNLLKETFNVEPKVTKSLIKVTVPEILRIQLSNLNFLANQIPKIKDVKLKRSGTKITIIISL